MAAAETFDRKAEDVGNIVFLEHVNFRVPDQQLATAFYVTALGFTRDPYLMVGLDNMWINLGRSQFHLPTGAPNHSRGRVGCVVADFDALPERLQAAEKWLAGTKYSYAIEKNHVDTTCPWGNRIRLHRPGGEYGYMTLGMPYVEFPVPVGHADGIARFYEEIMDAPARLQQVDGAVEARVQVGHGQVLRFRETADEIRAYDGYHIAVYITDFGGSHARLNERGIISQESNPYQYRFQEIVDPDSGKLLYEIEHEVRSFTHPMYARPLVNRNPAQRQPTYQPGQDAFYPRY
jgi:catechol 2,3-dioxygenase-like lactoylglutathione lyase family enzyme